MSAASTAPCCRALRRGSVEAENETAMVKRARNEGVSDTTPDDAAETPPRVAADRPVGDEADPPRKRPRLGTRELAPLERLPFEIRTQIIHELVDPHDWLKTLKSVEMLRRTGSSFNRDVAQLMQDPAARQAQSEAAARGDPAPEGPERTNTLLSTAGKLLVDKKTRLANLPIKNSATTRAESTLQETVLKCDLIPVAGKSEKSALTRDVLRADNSPLKYDALDSLALNVAYLEPRDRATVVGAACTLHRELIEDDVPAGLGGTLSKLIERAEHLSPPEQGQLLDAALDTGDPATKTRYFEAFAGKIDVMAKADVQTRIVDAIRDDQSEGRGYRLGLLAERLDRIPDRGFGGAVFGSPRDNVTRAILQLGRGDADRLWAMSKLVEKLDAVDPQTSPDVTSAAVAELKGPAVQTHADDSSQWYTAPATCRVEMAHHLAAHWDLLAEDEAESTKDFIRDVLKSSGNHRQKAQLLPYMGPKRRQRFVAGRLPDDTSDVVEDEHRQDAARQTAEGMSLRAADLEADEKAAFAFYVSDVLPADKADNALTYTISNTLPHFDREDANRMVKQAISECENVDPGSAVGLFNQVSRQAAQLDTATVSRLVRTAATVTSKHIQEADPEENVALRTLAIFAAQSVADKSREILVKGTSGLEAHLEAESAHSRRGYDNRPDGRLR